MKKYMIGIVLICIISSIGFLAVSKATDVDADVGQIMHVITADMKHEHQISWKTEKFGEPGLLEIRSKQFKNITTISAELTELPSYNEDKGFGLYTAHVTDLLSGTEYEYRISVGKRHTAWLKFKTETEDTACKVLIFGDSQSADYKEWRKTAETAWENNKDAAFFVTMGDLVDNGQDNFQWNAWFNGSEKLAAAIPVAPVMGNHEAYSLDWKMAKPDYYLSFFSLPSNGPADLKGYVYSYDYGDVHFAVINTQLQELQQWYPDLLEKQEKWLMTDFARTKKKWKVVLMHRGIWEYPFNGPLDVIGQTFVPIFDQYHVDLVFYGHVHSYARTQALKNGRPDSGGTIYITTGRSGEKVWDKSPQKPMDEFYYNPLDMPNYLVLEASYHALKVTAVKQNGEQLDQIEIKK